MLDRQMDRYVIARRWFNLVSLFKRTQQSFPSHKFFGLLRRNSVSSRNDVECKIFHSGFTISRSPKPAFTLAEVLITIAIIGVVAALTIPSLVQNYQKKQYVTQLKKQYTIANQVLQKLAYDYAGSFSLADTSLFSTGKTIELGDAISSYYKIAKNCKNATDNSFCLLPYKENYDGSGYTTNLNSYNTVYKFITADGTAISIGSYNSNCGTNNGLNENSPMRNVCADMIMDINGDNKPNTLGRDVFFFYITSNKTPLLYPRGGFEDNGGHTGTTVGDRYWKTSGYCYNVNKGGRWCSGRVIDENWEMNY